MAKTYAQQLDAVQAAIAAIESGAQSTEYEGRVIRRADLATLYRREERLMAKVDRESRGGVRVRGATPIG